MGRENRYMLFVPPNPPLRLDPEREVVIGRSRGSRFESFSPQSYVL